ncbi:DUF6333 family protein [Streptomyces fulvoviolaceus]|uniref:DUF6333 family protein n=1 Tax=Streptomyces fulvoviolaceus TaxID=285535 RepID=UPI00131EC247|nr:DUF6333 family protein [Streptomyces fulvoviolaceus]
MTETSFWDFPADAGVLRYGEYSLTIVHPGSPTEAVDLPARDRVAARRFAESFGTIDTILEDLGTVPATDDVAAGTRADLELVRVGCWGGVVEIIDPALGHTADDFPVLELTEELHKNLPDAVIIAACTIDDSTTHGAWAIFHPSGTKLLASGRHDQEDDWYVEGEPQAVIDAFGITGEALAQEGIHLDEPDHTFPWDALTQLALERVAPLNHDGRAMSVFRVRHTEDATSIMQEAWLEE